MASVRETERVTVDDLYKTPWKAELVNGQIVLMPPTGVEPGFAGDAIFASLFAHTQKVRRGRAVGDNKGFLVDLPHRNSFSPDVAFCLDEQRGMKFYQGAPAFAVEVRSENDYGAAAERDMAAKRADYFTAGTQVIWDVDLLSEDVVRVYRADNPSNPIVYRRGEAAKAEPAVPGWSIPVDDLFVD